jgi:hypothetical protein
MLLMGYLCLQIRNREVVVLQIIRRYAQGNGRNRWSTQWSVLVGLE